MNFLSDGNIAYLQFDLLAAERVQHAVFTRKGGTSPEPWNSLNFGGSVGDEPERIRKNFNIALAPFGFSRESIYDVWQVHGTDIAIAESPRLSKSPHQKADIILSNRPGVILFMRFADCVPILLYDRMQKIVGLVHAGWEGTVKKAAQVAVQAMEDRFDCLPANILACIGPSIGPDHYEVGERVIHQVDLTFQNDRDHVLKPQNGSVHFDLWESNRLLLLQSGVRHIESVNICTACHPSDWYSHRRDHGQTGRFGVFITLPDE
jgi:polyphenol oxidase